MDDRLEYPMKNFASVEGVGMVQGPKVKQEGEEEKRGQREEKPYRQTEKNKTALTLINNRDQ